MLLYIQTFNLSSSSDFNDLTSWNTVCRKGDILLLEETEKVTAKLLFSVHFIMTKSNKLQTFLADFHQGPRPPYEESYLLMQPN